MSLGKQAKILSDAQQRAALNHVKDSRDALRNRAMLLLSYKAGMRAKEISKVSWAMVCDSEGNLSNEIRLENTASKGNRGGRVIPMHGDLRAALEVLQSARGDLARPERPIIYSARGLGMLPVNICLWFQKLYADLGFTGASSHSGRRTFITRAARKITEAGGSLRDIQDLAGHSSIATTQRYIEISDTAKKKVVDLI